MRISFPMRCRQSCGTCKTSTLARSTVGDAKYSLLRSYRYPSRQLAGATHGVQEVGSFPTDCFLQVPCPGNASRFAMPY